MTDTNLPRFALFKSPYHGNVIDRGATPENGHTGSSPPELPRYAQSSLARSQGQTSPCCGDGRESQPKKSLHEQYSDDIKWAPEEGYARLGKPLNNSSFTPWMFDTSTSASTGEDWTEILSLEWRRTKRSLNAVLAFRERYKRYIEDLEENVTQTLEDLQRTDDLMSIFTKPHHSNTQDSDWAAWVSISPPPSPYLPLRTLPPTRRLNRNYYFVDGGPGKSVKERISFKAAQSQEAACYFPTKKTQREKVTSSLRLQIKETDPELYNSLFPIKSPFHRDFSDQISNIDIPHCLGRRQLKNNSSLRRARLQDNIKLPFRAKSNKVSPPRRTADQTSLQKRRPVHAKPHPKISFRHERSRRYELQTWLEDSEQITQTPREYSHFSRTEEPQSNTKPNITDEELTEQIQEQFRSGSVLQAQNYSSSLLFESFLGRHTFAHTHGVEISNIIYLFHIVSVQGQRKCKGLVFLRSNVRGWIQRQKKRCKAFAECDKPLAEAIVANRFQLMVFPGRWERTERTTKNSHSPGRFSPLAKTYKTEFPMLGSTSVDTRQNRQLVSAVPFLRYDHLWRTPQSLFASVEETREAIGPLPPKQWVQKVPDSGRQGRRRYRMYIDESDLTSWSVSRGGRRTATAFQKQNMKWQSSSLSQRRNKKGWIVEYFSGASWAYDRSTRNTISLKQERQISSSG